MITYSIFTMLQAPDRPSFPRLTFCVTDSPAEPNGPIAIPQPRQAPCVIQARKNYPTLDTACDAVGGG